MHLQNLEQKERELDQYLDYLTQQAQVFNVDLEHVVFNITPYLAEDRAYLLAWGLRCGRLL